MTEKPKITDAAAIDQATVARSFGRASASYDAAADLQATARDELLSRLEHFHLEPKIILDLGAGTGLATPGLQQRFPKAQILSIDLAVPMLQRAQRRRKHESVWAQLKAALSGQAQGRADCIAAEAGALPLRSGSVQLVFSNLMLQWCLPPDAVLAEVRRVLAPEGLFLCSTFGPNTLQELRTAWSAVDDQPHVNDFIDLHDLGSAMTRAGLTEPVLDVDRIQRDYKNVTDLLRELKDLGARNALQGRRRSLTGKHRLTDMIKVYEARFSSRASWELIYGSAFAPASASRIAHSQLAADGSTEVRIPLQSLNRKTGR